MTIVNGASQGRPPRELHAATREARRLVGLERHYSCSSCGHDHRSWVRMHSCPACGTRLGAAVIRRAALTAA